MRAPKPAANTTSHSKGWTKLIITLTRSRMKRLTSRNHRVYMPLISVIVWPSGELRIIRVVLLWCRHVCCHLCSVRIRLQGWVHVKL